MGKKILLIFGHPNKDSFCYGLLKAYEDGALETNKAEIDEIILSELNFDIVLHKGYNEIQPLEPDLIIAQQKILWANHLVFVYPNWWGAMPALMKGFFERCFLPSFAFKYRVNSLLSDKLLKGKTADILVTMDTPAWYYRWVYFQPGLHQLKKCILEFCGIRVKNVCIFSPVKMANVQKIKQWLLRAKNLGEKSVNIL
ncbi:MAG: NAD(P)H-dependent oxidoreductase [Alphaproteobacteria bacterium]